MAVYILCGVIVIQCLIHVIERRDLYNRIMSRDLNEYKGKPCARVNTAHDRVIRRWRGHKGGERE